MRHDSGQVEPGCGPCVHRRQGAVDDGADEVVDQEVMAALVSVRSTLELLGQTGGVVHRG